MALQNFSNELPSETMASVVIPQDIITEILSRLQVKPLLRFRCVSKPWCYLIDSEEFVKKHLKQSVATKTNLNLILEFKKSFTSISLNSLYPNGVVVSIDNVEGLAPPPFSVSNADWSVLLNSCNGLSLIRIKRLEGPQLFVWNPFTRKYIEIPVPPVDCPPISLEHMKNSLIVNEKYAFAYVSETSEYKIVRVIEFAKFDESWSWFGSWMVSEAKMFSSTSNVWEEIQDFPYCISCSHRLWGAHLNGILHTVVNNGSSTWSIMGFDVRSKKHAMVPKLELGVSKRFNIKVDVLEGDLSLINEVFDDKVDVWVMKEYGVQDSWVKLLSVSLKPTGFFCGTLTFSLKRRLQPLAYSKDGEDVLLSLNEKRLYWYNLRTETEREVTVNMASDFYTGLCFESFASFPGFISVGNVKDDLKKDCKEKGDHPWGQSRQLL